MKTKDRIVESSRELFNEFGVQAITTNHIAAHLGISPGNLYYHFRNKEDIISSIYDKYVEQMSASYIVNSNESMTLSHIAQYAEQMVTNLWDYRFLYSAITDILQRDDSLKTRYVELNRRQMEKGATVIKALRDAGLIDVDDDDVIQLAEAVRLIESFNVTYLQCKSQEPQGIAAIYNTVAKLLLLLKPYTRGQTKADTTQLIQLYRSKAES